jgi:hypothetical protein
MAGGRSRCKQCGGSSICEHGRRKRYFTRKLEAAQMNIARQKKCIYKGCGGSSLCMAGKDYYKRSAESSGM